MTTRHIRLIVIGAFGVGLALTQQACGGIGSDKAAGPAPSATAGSSGVKAASPATSRPASGKTVADTAPDGGAFDDDAGPGDLAAGGGGGADGRAKDCGDDGVELTVTLQPDRGDGAARGLVAVTNTGKRPCHVEGRAVISLTDAADEVVNVPTRKVNEPGAAMSITLRPGRTAFQGIKWVPCDKGDESCPTGNGLRFSLHGSTNGPGARLSGFPRAESSGITMKSLRIGTLQPAAQGVVAW
jgi:hypothetical protein